MLGSLLAAGSLLPVAAHSQQAYPMEELRGVDEAVGKLRSAVVARYQATMQITEASGLTQFIGGVDIVDGIEETSGEHRIPIAGMKLAQKIHKHAVVEYYSLQRTMFQSAFSLAHLQSTPAFRTHAWALEMMTHILNHEAWRTLSATLQVGPHVAYQAAGSSLQQHLQQLGVLAKGMPVMGLHPAKTVESDAGALLQTEEGAANATKVPTEHPTTDKLAEMAKLAADVRREAELRADLGAAERQLATARADKASPAAAGSKSSMVLEADAANDAQDKAAQAAPTFSTAPLSTAAKGTLGAMTANTRRNIEVTRLGAINTNLAWLADLYAGIGAQASNMRGDLKDIDEGVSTLLAKTTALPGQYKATLPIQLLSSLVWLDYVVQSSGNIVSQSLNYMITNPLIGLAPTTTALRLLIDHFRLVWQNKMAAASTRGWGQPWPIISQKRITEAPWIPTPPWAADQTGSQATTGKAAAPGK